MSARARIADVFIAHRHRLTSFEHRGINRKFGGRCRSLIEPDAGWEVKTPLLPVGYPNLTQHYFNLTCGVETPKGAVRRSIHGVYALCVRAPPLAMREIRKPCDGK